MQELHEAVLGERENDRHRKVKRSKDLNICNSDSGCSKVLLTAGPV